MTRSFFGYLAMAVTLVVNTPSFAQAPGKCNRQAEILFPDLTIFNIQRPEDDILLPQYEKLFTFQRVLELELSTRHQSYKIIPVALSLEGKGFLNKQQRYILYGFVRYTASGQYQLHLILKTVCTDRTLAETDVYFQLYPQWDPGMIAKQAVAKLASVIDIGDFEENERDQHNYGRGGDIWGGRITIDVDKKLVKGEQADVRLKVVDCDGRILPNKTISTAGTTGGTFTPATFTTNADGFAMSKFRLTTDKTAILKAQCETLNVMGCQDLYTGTAIIKGLGGAPVKVEIWYGQTETKTLKRATLPGIQVSGGQETEVIDMVHHAVLYHFPSAESLKQGLIVEVEKGNTPGARTAFVSETGWFLYTKNIREAMITAGPEGAAVRETEAGEETIMSGNASLDHPSEVVFHKGDVSTPAFFAWSVEYPTSDQGIAGGTFSITKGDPGVDWQVKKIDDPKSPYKTEYLLNCRLDAAEELKKGNKAMKDLLGVDVDDLANMLNPTNPQKDMAGASGWQTITVRILSPYGQ